MLTYLIDDDQISLYLTEHMLRLNAFTDDIRPFAAADEALAYLLARLPTELPEVIFLDLNMPVLDGWDFLQALAPYASALQGHCHIYILTSSLALDDTAKAQEYALVSGVLHKPIDEADIRAIWHRLRTEPQG